MKIIAIEQSKRVGGGCTLRFEEGAFLKVTLSALTEFGLFTGREMDDSELLLLKTAMQSKMTKAKAASMLAARPLSEFELKKRLTEKGSSEKDSDEAAEWLKGIGAVNDPDYASLIAHRYAAKGYGAAKIKDELYKRGIPRELWEAALKEYTANEHGIDRLLSSKLKGSSDKKEIRKAAEAFYRRGFSWDEIQNALSRYENARQEESD